VRLLVRTTRSVIVTPEGAGYYERVIRLLADLSDIESTAKQSIARPSGRLRVDVATAIATHVLIPALPDFYRAYPQIEIELGIGNRQTDMVSDDVDCVVRAGVVEDEMLVARRIGEFHLVTCASPGYLAARGTPTTIAELEKRHHLLGMVSTRTGRPIPFKLSKAGEDVEVMPHPRLSVDDTNAHLAAGIAGLGILQAPAYMLQGAVQAGQLVPVLQEWSTPAVPVHVAYRQNRFLGAKVRVFIDWTVALFERHPDLKLD
jgi:DNA-binding transcriptional LysR family regulator